MVATPEALNRAALTYLARYAAPAGHLRRLLLARVTRSAKAHGTDPEAGAQAVETIISRLVDQGLLDDGVYARARARSLFRRGASGYAIRGRLAQKGVAAADIDVAIAGLAEEAAQPELAAALAFARRRRLGPFRPAERRAAHRDRDLASLGRQGFDYALVRRVVDCEDLGELEAEAGITGAP
jgi:regulatory protein